MYIRHKIIHIVAVGMNGEIGKDDKMLWHIPEDFKYFREKTLGHAMIMGRKTYDGLPNKLSRRCVHVVSRDKSNPTWIDPLHNALNRCVGACFHLNTNIIWVAGGQQVYESTEDIVDEIFLTRVHKEFNEANKFYRIPQGFQFEGYIQKEVQTKEGWLVTFEKWVKK